MEKQPHPADVNLSENRDQKLHRTLREIPGKKKTNSSNNNSNITTEINHLEADHKVVEVMANYFITTADCI